MLGAGRTPLMAKPKKPKGGKHTTPRTPVQLPIPWLRVAQRQARAVPTPTSWFLIGLIKAHAEAHGVPPGDLPPAPWDEEPEKPKPVV